VQINLFSRSITTTSHVSEIDFLYNSNKFEMQSKKTKTNDIVVVEKGSTKGILPTNNDRMAPEGAMVGKVSMALQEL